MISQDKSKEIEEFDRYGPAMDFDAFAEDGYARVFREFRRHVQGGDHLRIVDLGCATGSFTSRMALMGFSVTGLDITPACVQYARVKYPELQLEVGDVERLPFGDESCDIVTLFGVLHHFPDMSLALRECRRVLKKGGLLFALDPRLQNPFIWLYRSKQSPLYSSKGVTENESPLTRKQLLTALTACSFASVQVYAIAGMPLNRKSNKFSGTVRMLMPLYNLSEKLFDLPMLRPALGSYLISAAIK